MQRTKLSKVVLFLVAVTLLLSWAGQLAIGQTTGGTLRGTVKDASGAVVPDAVVTATSEATGAKFNTVTSSSGLFSFPNLLVGDYSVSVEKTGFSKFIRTKVAISANKVVESDATLEVGAVTTIVEVTGGAELISTTSSQLGATISGKESLDLPNSTLGGSPLNLAILLPNTTTQAGGVLGEGGSVGGNRPRNNNFTIDGVDNNDISVTGSLQPVIQDAVAEFNLISNQFSAEYGHSTAGQFNIITKSGTNDYHGSAFYYGQNKNLNAFDNLTKAAYESGDLDHKPRWDFNRVGGTFGGPIKKDKLFFFGAYEYRTRGEDATGVLVQAPTQAGMSMLNNLAVNSAVKDILKYFPTASSASNSIVVNGQTIPVGNVQFFAADYDTQHDIQGNVDYNFGKHQLRGRYLWDRYRAPNSNPSLPVPEFTGAVFRNAQKIAFTDVWAITSRLANDFRLSYSRNVNGWSIPASAANFPNAKIDDLGLNVGPEDNSPQGGWQNTYQALNNLSYLVGKHQIKGGIEYRNTIAPSDFLPRARGEWDYANMNEFINDLVPSGANGALRGAGLSRFAGNQQSIYWFMQDDYKISKNLTLNLGMRYEYTTNPRDANLQEQNSISTLPGVFEFRKPKTDTNNWGPRVGFAYAPSFSGGVLGALFGSGKTSIRGGGAIAYDVNFQNLVLLQLPPQLQTEQNPDITCGAANRPAWCVTGRGFLAGGGLLQVNVPPTTRAEARSATGSLIVDQQAPKTYTWTLSIQREFAKNYVLEVRYLGTRGQNLPVQRRLNAISVFEKHPELALPTYFTNASVPATFSLTAPTMQDFLNARDLRYSADGFDGGYVTAFPGSGDSIYHAGSIEVRRRFAKGLFMLGSYTWSRTIDNATNELFSSLVNPRRPQNPYNIGNERGLSALDMPNKFTLSWTYELPKMFPNGAASKIVDGWQISGSYLAQTGQPMSAVSGQDANGDFDSAGDRAILNPAGGKSGSKANYILRNPSTGATSIVTSVTSDERARVVGYVAVKSTAKYVVAMPGTAENESRVGRNTIRTLGLNNWNISILKNFKFTESKEFQFRTEFYNAFNHRQYSLGLPTYEQSNDNALSSTYANVSALQFLDASQFSGGSRTMQMSLKFVF